MRRCSRRGFWRCARLQSRAGRSTDADGTNNAAPRLPKAAEPILEVTYGTVVVAVEAAVIVVLGVGATVLTVVVTDLLKPHLLPFS